jgi:hypothetical protein
MTTRVNPEALVEMYDALDTVEQDFCQLAEEHAELEPILLSEAHDLREEATARMLLEQDRRRRGKVIEQRRNYATASIKGLYFTPDDELIAEAEYLAQFDNDQEGIDKATDRLIGYRVVIRRLMRKVAIVSADELNPGRRAKLPEPQVTVYDGPRYRINPEVKRIDELGRTWINLCHPRGVLTASSFDESPEEVVAQAGVVANLGQGMITEEEAGVVHVQFTDGRTPLSFKKSSTIYRVNDQGEVLVIRPTNIVGSVIDTMFYQDQGQLNGVLSRRSEASEVAQAAAGQPGSIWSTFEDLHGDPRPLLVPKQN